MKFDTNKYTWRINTITARYGNRAIFICSVIFVTLYFYVVNTLEQSLRVKEVHDVERWIFEIKEVSNEVAMTGAPIPLFALKRQSNVPYVLVDDKLNVVESNLINDDVINHPDKLRRMIRSLSQVNSPIHFQYIWSDKGHMFYYGNSRLLEGLDLIPYMQFVVAAVFMLMAYIAVHNARQKEQNLVWVGLAKETAHQLGTPISSLIGWVDYLREQQVEPEAVDEMERDLNQLTKVTDRFSKIGSDTQLNNANVNEVVERVAKYFKGRVPRSVTIEHDAFATSPLYANMNIVLIEWVIENLIKNAIDALQGNGVIRVNMHSTEDEVLIDVSDNGRGIPKSNWRKIFEPGYTTKVRGWGLGLSLSRRVVEDYHNGKIGVESSAIGVGTTIRVALKRVYEL